MNTPEAILKNPSATLIDVRSPLEFKMEPLSGAINIPVEQIQMRAKEIQKMSKPIMVFCRSGARSGMALAVLKQAGVTEVYNGGSIYDLMSLIQA
jgi:phage shock protein E